MKILFENNSVADKSGIETFQLIRWCTFGNKKGFSVRCTEAFRKFIRAVIFHESFMNSNIKSWEEAT